MATLQIQVDTVVGQVKLSRVLEAVKPAALLKGFGGRFLSYVNKQFRTRGEGQWRPLSPLTLLLRRHGGDMPLRDTGKYAQSFVMETDQRTFVEVGSNLKTTSGIPLAMIHEYGTAPYTIRARTAKVLAAKTREGAWIFFGKEVQHPGVPPRPVLPSKAVAERLVQEVVDGALARIEAPGTGRFGG